MPLGLCLVCFYKKNYMTFAFSSFFTRYLLEIYNVEVLQNTAIIVTEAPSTSFPGFSPTRSLSNWTTKGGIMVVFCGEM